jgi:chitinase
MGSGGGGGSALPARIEGYWYWGYSGPSIASTQSNAPAANYIAWFAAVGTGAKDGHLTFSSVGTPSTSDIAAWKAAGKFITLSIGGYASDVGQPAELDLDTASQEANFYADVVSAVATYGFQGIDIDLESDSGQWDTTQMCKLFADLKAHFGAGFAIDIAPAPYQLHIGNVYAALYAACGDQIDLVSPQWYSQCGQTDSWFENTFIGPDLAIYTGTIGIPSTKILIGAADNNPALGQDCGAPGGPSTYCTAYGNWTSANPTKPLRGLKWFMTDSDQMASTPWIYGSTAKACLGL